MVSKPLTVAVVDDERNLRTLLRAMLTQAGFDVIEYADAETAYQGFINSKPHLLLTDVWMPGESGHDLCRRIRRDLEDIITPIIIMTGNDDLSSIDEAFESGATDFFPKPINYPLLVQRIRYALRNSEAWHMQTSYQSQMLQSEKMASLGQLAAGVAHEINNPIGYVLSNVQVLGSYTESLLQYIAQLESNAQSGASSEDRQAALTLMDAYDQVKAIKADLPEMLADIEEGLGRISEIVKSLKIYAHPEQEKLTPTNLIELVQSVKKMIVGDLKYRADVKTEFPEAAVWVMANPSKLYQVLMNLLINAVQAIEHDHGQVCIKLKAQGDRALIEVTDNGKGMAEEELSRIFDPFYTTKDIGEGTGLGLSVSKAIVEKHEGRLSVVSEVNKGTTFTLSLRQMPTP
ncbi:sensor histidine kinase [Saccharospirillum alexandrii]|uniref:sensor histidine kinase n=1 Tax=Saccharospirillum alexandrii TaxID=2448477 RepID=UPI000FD75604|nr:ATP-binding protein [Saccharospirillum alexandrii]